MILFIHIPKTAGSTLNYIIKNNFKESALEIRWHWTKWISRHELTKRIAAFDCDNKLLIHGHFVYGVHEILHHENPRYVTFVRDPLKRAISGYLHVKRDPRSSFHKEYLSERSLSDFLLDPAIHENDNGLVRRLSGIGNEVPYGKVTSAHFNLAIDNLDKRFIAVGLTEKFDLSIELFRNLGIFESVYYWKQNISKNRASNGVERVDEVAAERFKSLNRHDYALYAYCSDKFHNSVSNLRFSQSKFNLYNRLYNLTLLPKKIARKIGRVISSKR